MKKILSVLITISIILSGVAVNVSAAGGNRAEHSYIRLSEVKF